jgi:hypothetical protein
MWLWKMLPGLLLLIGISIQCRSQMADSVILTTTLEKITEVTEEDPDYQSIAEGPGGERVRTVPLNSITEKDLRQLDFLSPNQVESILQYIHETGQILSVYELRSVPGLDTATVRRLLPYLAPGDPDAGLPLTLGNLAKRGRHEATLFLGQGLEKKKGYLSNVYEGSMVKEIFRYSYTFSNRIRAAVSGEKDAGEKFFGRSQPWGMDYWAGYVSVMNTGFLKSLIIGNFTASFGQGLVTGTGSRLGSVVGFNAPLRVSQGVRASSSTYEGSFQRGIAASARFSRVVVSAFYSRHSRDANALALDSTANDASLISSFQTTGYHRTASEIGDKNMLKETLYGGNLSFTGNFFRIGATAMHGEWSAGVAPAAKPYNLWYFRGRSLTTAGMDIILRLRYISLFAEGGNSFNGAWAWIAGMSAEPAQGLLFSVTARSYDPSYKNIFCNAVGQETRNANEQGCLLNVTARMFPALTLAAYADIFRHPWLRYRVNSPSEGMEAGLLATYLASPGISLSGRMLYREYEQNAEGPAGSIPATERFSTVGLRFQADWQALAAVVLKTQFEIKSGLAGFKGSPAGYMAGQEVRAELLKRRLQVSFRYALFDIPSWDLRIYSYEPDISGSFSVPVYDGRGLRAMLMAKGRITRHVYWWVKYGISWYENKTTIGSGLEEIPGNIQSDIRLQVAGNW